MPALAHQLSFARRLCFTLLVAMLCAGCRREQISVYNIPKESDTAAAPAPPITFQPPADWKSETPGGMSLATFSMADRKAEVSVMTFPGEGASQLSLINIVRSESGLAPLSDDELAKLQESVTIGDGKGALIDLTAGTASSTNASPHRILVAILGREGVTWFFKMAGTSDVVTAQKPALLAFLKSVAFNETGGAPASPHGDGSPHGQGFASANTGQMPALPPSMVDEAASQPKPTWDVPAGWNEVPPTQMLLAKFAITGASGSADVTVSSFPGQMGGLLANVNRWRGQAGLPSIGEAELEKSYTSLDVPDGKAMLVDVTGTKSGKEVRLLGVIWPRNGTTWFYKMMGNPATVGAQKEALLKFIQSVRYPNA